MTEYDPPGEACPGSAAAHDTHGAPAAYDAVVLAGGAARRLGGADKPGVRVGGRALLDRVLAACAGAATTVVVAGQRATARPVVWAHEDPAGAGPVAALEAGLRHTTAEYVVVLSADLPFLDGATVRRLLAALSSDHTARGVPGAGSGSRDVAPGSRDVAPGTRDVAPGTRGAAPGTRGAAPGTRGAAPGTRGAAPGTRGAAPDTRGAAPGTRGAAPGTRDVAPDTRGAAPDTRDVPPDTRDAAPDTTDVTCDGVLLVDPDGRDQPLVAAYRAKALRRELDSLAAGHGGLTGLPLRRLTAALDLTRLSDPVASFDCDTWDDIAAARSRIREHGHVLDEWISAVKDELGLDLDVDTGILLDLARDAAHGVARPAAPLTTFLVGYAAAQAQGGPEAVAEAARKAAALALRWADEDTPDAKPDNTADTSPDARPGTTADARPGTSPAAKPPPAPEAHPGAPAPEARPDAG